MTSGGRREKSAVRELSAVRESSTACASAGNCGGGEATGGGSVVSAARCPASMTPQRVMIWLAMAMSRCRH